MILRHKKGDKKLYVYTGNLSGMAVNYVEVNNNTTVTTVTNDLVLGAAKYKNGNTFSYDNYATGTVYWAKLWMADLGDNTCRDLAAWTHGTMSFRVAKYKDYYKPTGERTLFTFLADVLLPFKRVYGNYNWPQATLNQYLQTRVFFALPVQYQALIAMTRLVSWDGYTSYTERDRTIYKKLETVTQSNAFIFIPCAIEVGASEDDQLNRECNGVIKYMTGSNLVGRYSDGFGDSYWTRSCSTYSQSIGYIYTVDYVYTTDSASISYWTTYSTQDAIRIMFSI